MLYTNWTRIKVFSLPFLEYLLFPKDFTFLLEFYFVVSSYIRYIDHLIALRSQCLYNCALKLYFGN
ncbi:hypothetical protein SAMN03080614_10342 [Anaerobranca gottschalkii DSM 13577]|uniref:Uncharacterized protein n=1 Tax=Anaerobranca gottschalkii DSM 13577 TaxID=1120990 RepID=A0A1I0B7Y1_9FIRM|nr:hypothetical protein SAMN03080614_10342 [Anaerobranca gottschalkii DSM 13577]